MPASLARPVLALNLCLAALALSCQPRTLEIEGRRVPLAELVTPKHDRSHESFFAEGRRIMIASDSAEASAAALEVYRAGGNVVDAAIAASFAICVTRPQSTGLAGGGFLLLHDAVLGRTRAFDFRERAPAAAARDMYIGPDGKPDPRAALFGPRAVATPGNVRGFVEIQREFGKLPLAVVLAPALRLAREGFPMYPDLAASIEDAREDMDEAMRAVFLPGGKPPQVGDIFVQTDLARSLASIADSAGASFYSGEIADALDRYMRTHGGVLRKSDLAAYRVLRPDPLWTEHRGRRLATMPAPSSGVFLFQALRMTESADAAALFAADRPAFYHRSAEILRRIFFERARYGGDARYFAAPRDLHEPAYAARLAANIRPDRATPSAELGAPQAGDAHDSPETTHISVIDSSGDAVSTTHSINYRLGARVMLPGYGLVLNDTMDDFSAAPGQANVYGLIGGVANAIAPGKTPLSSMAPTLVFEDNAVRYALGAPGGSRIISSLYMTLVYALDLGEPAYAAVARGRIHHQYAPDVLFAEDSALSARQREVLDGLGHETRAAEIPAKVFLVERRPDRLIGVSDPRGDGRPAGE